MKKLGVRSGNCLTADESAKLLQLPNPTTLKSMRDRPILAILLGCGLRRRELAVPTRVQIKTRCRQNQLPAQIPRCLGILSLAGLRKLDAASIKLKILFMPPMRPFYAAYRLKSFSAHAAHRQGAFSESLRDQRILFVHFEIYVVYSVSLEANHSQ